MRARLRRVRRFLRRRWPAVVAIAAAACLLVLFLIYSRGAGPVQVYPAFSTPISSALIGVPRFVGGPNTLARDFAWRQALVLVEIEAAANESLGTVIDQFPLPQMLIRAGDTLTVTVSLGLAGEALPTDARVGGRVPLRLTPIGLATAAVRQTQIARRAGARTAAAPTTSPTSASGGATPTDSDAVATRRAREAAGDVGATRTLTATATTTGTLSAPAITASPSLVPTAVGTRPPPEPSREPAATSAPAEPTAPPGPPEPPTPPPPPPEARSRNGQVSGRAHPAET